MHNTYIYNKAIISKVTVNKTTKGELLQKYILYPTNVDGYKCCDPR